MGVRQWRERTVKLLRLSGLQHEFYADSSGHALLLCILGCHDLDCKRSTEQARGGYDLEGACGGARGERGRGDGIAEEGLIRIVLGMAICHRHDLNLCPTADGGVVMYSNDHVHVVVLATVDLFLEGHCLRFACGQIAEVELPWLRNAHYLACHAHLVGLVLVREIVNR